MKNTHHDTPETDAAFQKLYTNYTIHPATIDLQKAEDFARKLERERDKALRELREARNTNVNVRKERGARVMELKKELQEARAALSGRTVSCSQCKESAKKATELESKVATLEAQKEQWRMSSVCREKDSEIQAMREAIKEAHDALSNIASMPEYDQDDAHRLRHKANIALAKH